MERHTRLQTIHPKTRITKKITGLIHPPHKPIPRLPHPAHLIRTHLIRPHRIFRKRVTERSPVRPFGPEQPNGIRPVVVIGEETGEIIRSGIPSQERGQLGRENVIDSALAQHHSGTSRTRIPRPS